MHQSLTHDESGGLALNRCCKRERMSQHYGPRARSFTELSFQKLLVVQSAPDRRWGDTAGQGRSAPSPMKMIEGWFSAATLNSMRTNFSASPCHFEVSVAAEMLKKVARASWASACRAAPLTGTFNTASLVQVGSLLLAVSGPAREQPQLGACLPCNSKEVRAC